MKLYKIAVVLLVCVIGGLYYFLKQTEKQLVLLKNEVDLQIIELKSVNYNLINNNELTLALDYSGLDSLPCAYAEGVLVLKLNANSCNACYWDVIDSLKKYAGDSALPFMVVGTFDRTSAFREKVESLKLDNFPSFNYENKGVLSVAEDYEAPFLFWYHPQGYISDVLFLDKKQPGQIEQYVNMLVRKLSLEY